VPAPWVEPEDVGHALCFLASDESRYVTGVAFPGRAGMPVKWSHIFGAEGAKMIFVTHSLAEHEQDRVSRPGRAVGRAWSPRQQTPCPSLATDARVGDERRASS